MDLYAGTPYWMVKNPLWSYCNPLREDIRTEAVVIGAGITGALVAHRLRRAGIDCCVVDKRTPATGSSCASTALLQYEIDVPLCRMARMMPEQDAATAYRSCLEAIDQLERLFRRTKVDAAFRRVPSVYYASNRKGMRLLHKEYEIRKRYGLPAELLEREALRAMAGFEAPGALINRASAQLDAFRAAAGLLRHTIRRYGLDLYSHTEITAWDRTPEGYLLTTADGKRIACRYAIVAAGFEAAPFLRRKPMRLTSTFAIVSEPVSEQELWPDRSLIWETRDPYLYIRTDNTGRIIVGGEDISTNTPLLRRLLLSRKAAVLERKFRKLFPHIPFKRELAWAGTFSSTRDGLPLIGPRHDDPHMLYALGYGGNGITFSVIAAQLLTSHILGRPDPRAPLFSPERPSLR